jgi:hypothetical protein
MRANALVRFMMCDQLFIGRAIEAALLVAYCAIEPPTRLLIDLFSFIALSRRRGVDFARCRSCYPASGIAALLWLV